MKSGADITSLTHLNGAATEAAFCSDPATVHARGVEGGWGARGDGAGMEVIIHPAH